MNTAPILVGPVASWFPERTLSVRRLPELATLPRARREHAPALGIDEIRVAAEESEVDLAVRAAAVALRQAGLAADQLDALLLVQGRAPRYLLASEATMVQHELGATRAFTATVGDLGCVSVSSAFALASALLRGDPRCRNVLVVSAAKAPTRARYRAPMTVLGDGAAAVLLTTSGTGRYELVDQIVRSDGRYADLFRIDYRNAPADTWVEECTDEAGYSFRLAVESRNRFTALNAELLARNGVPAHRIDVHITQNLAAGAFAFWQEALGVPISGVCASNLARFGHLGSADVLLNIEAAAPTVPPDGYSLVMNSSPVAAWSGWLLRRLPEREAA